MNKHYFSREARISRRWASVIATATLATGAAFVALGAGQAQANTDCTAIRVHTNVWLGPDFDRVSLSCLRVDPGLKVQGRLDCRAELDPYTSWLDEGGVTQPSWRTCTSINYRNVFLKISPK